MCDICIESRKKSDQYSGEKIDDAIARLVDQSPLDIKQLSNRFPHYKRELVIETVRVMLDKEELKMDDGIIKPCHR